MLLSSVSLTHCQQWPTWKIPETDNTLILNGHPFWVAWRKLILSTSVCPTCDHPFTHPVRPCCMCYVPLSQKAQCQRAGMSQTPVFVPMGHCTSVLLFSTSYSVLLSLDFSNISYQDFIFKNTVLTFFGAKMIFIFFFLYLDIRGNLGWGTNTSCSPLHWCDFGQVSWLP